MSGIFPRRRPKVFISYRRADGQAICDRIYDSLAKALGSRYIFKDVDNIPAGTTFREVLLDAINQCDIVLVLIGKYWVVDNLGRRRLDNPDDFVRLEIETSLNQHKLFIPITIDGATPPNRADLPPSIQKIMDWQFVTVRHDPDFHRDMRRLIKHLNRLAKQSYWLSLFVAVVSFLAMMCIGIGFAVNNPDVYAAFFTQPTPITVLITNTHVPPTPTQIPTETFTPSPSPTFSGGGSNEIAFFSNRDGNNEIYRIDLEGLHITRLTNDEHEDLRPVWSPDGSRIAFHSNRNENYEIYIMNADGSNLVQLTDHSGDDWYPAWSPDGLHIAFASNYDGDNEIYVIGADGFGATVLTNNDVSDITPAWSPDGSRLIFRSDRDGNGEIYVMNADGSNPINLTNHPADDRWAVWSPDGSKIAFQSDRDGNWEIYVMDANGANPTNLTNYRRADDRAPAWSPDGSRIAFVTIRNGNFEIYLMNSDGTNLARVTNNTADDWYPSWRP